MLELDATQAVDQAGPGVVLEDQEVAQEVPGAALEVPEADQAGLEVVLEDQAEPEVVLGAQEAAQVVMVVVMEGASMRTLQKMTSMLRTLPCRQC
jgi:hypothetical protein